MCLDPIPSERQIARLAREWVSKLALQHDHQDDDFFFRPELAADSGLPALRFCGKADFGFGMLFKGA